MLIDDLHPEQIKEKIREFVTKNPGTSEGELIRHLEKNEVCSKDTTRKYVKLLEDSSDLIVEKDKRRNNITHHLYINNKSEFAKIEKELSKLDGDIDSIIKSENSKIRSGNVEGEQGISTPNRAQMYVIYNLIILLWRIGQLIRDKDDRQVLINKVIELMLSVTLKNKAKITN